MTVYVSRETPSRILPLRLPPLGFVLVPGFSVALPFRFTIHDLRFTDLVLPAPAALPFRFTIYGFRSRPLFIPAFRKPQACQAPRAVPPTMAAGWVHPGYPRVTRALPPTTPRIMKPQRRSAEESTLEKAARSPVSLDIAATPGLTCRGTVSPRSGLSSRRACGPRLRSNRPA